MLAIFIAWPWLALLPAGLFLILYRVSRRRIAGTAGAAWLLYAGYEYAMHRRWLCTGECNIRVDLLLLYPMLIILSAVAVTAGIRTLIRRRRAMS